MKKLLALTLAVLMLLPAMAACNKNTDDPAGTTAPAETEPAETLDPNDRRNAKDNLPADFNMNGETVGVLTRHTYRQIDWDGADAVESDVLAQAVFNRTEAVQERLGLIFELTDLDLHYNDYGKTIEENIMAGDDTWSIILAAGNASIRLGYDHLFQDVSGNPYLDFDQPWWATTVMEEMSVNGKIIRYMMGDAIMNTYLWAYVSFFNKRIYEDNFGDPDELYKKAIAGEWYYDDLMTMCEAVLDDVNGDGKRDEDDTYGVYFVNPGALAYMERAANFRMYSRDEDGLPYLDHDTERGMEVLEKMYKVVWETPGVYNEFNKWGNDAEYFAQGNVLFCINSLDRVLGDYMRNMEDDYGILPMPLVDEKQTEYVAPITTSATFLVIPKTCQDDRIGGVIEALASESYRSVVEVFYESALKMKYSRDSYSGQCIDIIKNALYKDFISEYSGHFGEIAGQILRYCVENQSKSYQSMYKGQAQAANKKISDFLNGILAASEN